MSTTSGTAEQRDQVILLPGSVLPGDLAYEALLEELGDGVSAVVKDLEVYAGDEPPASYSLDLEVDGIDRAAGAAGFERFHLGGYSAGGAACLAFAARRPERLSSLVLIEPAWAGNDGLDPAEQAVWQRYQRVMTLPPEQMMPAFVAANLRPGVEPPAPPPGPAPAWMAKRPAGLDALIASFLAGSLDVDSLGRLRCPVYFALGGLSNPDHYAKIAERLAAALSDFTLEVFEMRHHFDPPHRAEPERLAASLRDLWARAATTPPGAA
ncbi:MAG TPA: alpha/beta hydrolase [Solirubrobacterales bacterium]|nr:alpha/beta hydrolase [Solirubrobacterales bacterium]